MRLEPDSPQRTGEQRRYFPDWEYRLLEVREELEADHNSYLAGGYAEEFGYLAEAGASRGVPLLDGEPPEESPEWRCQAAAMHPGYPIRPHPIVLEDEQPRDAFSPAAGRPRVPPLSEGVLAALRGMGYHGGFVRVVNRPYERERHRAAQRTTAVLMRVVAALSALRRELSRRH